MRQFWVRKKKSNKARNGSNKQSVTSASSAGMNQPISAHLPTNVEWLYNELGASSDIVTRKIFDAAFGMEGVLIYIDHLVDQQTVNQMIVQPIIGMAAQNPDVRSPLDGMELLKNKALSVGRIEEVRTLGEALDQLLGGHTLILLQGCQAAISADSAGGEKRPVEEPSSQTVTRGPKDGFTENIHTNLSLIRRRIKSPQLRINSRQIGTQTKTQVSVVYMKGIAKDGVVKEVMARLDRIDTDSIMDSGYIEEYIQDAAFTPFPTIQSSERPDAVSAGVLEGQVAIIVDGSPFVLVAPVTFTRFFQSSEDYYQHYDISTFLRFIRFGGFLVSILLPSLYIAISTFHQEMLPTPLVISLASQREGVPFPALIEAFMMEITFEVLREAGVRMPRAIGPAISIVGALVLGQAAVQAGIVSAAMVIVVSFTAISNFVIPYNNMGNASRIIRFVMMLLGGTLGLFGIMAGVMVMLIHLASLRSFGVAYLAPLSPFMRSSWKDVFLRMPRWAMKNRPIMMSSNNRTRGGEGQKPKAPAIPGHEQDPSPEPKS
ncbi:spore germination protein [Paenibacillus montanisoli]|uniref:Spore germination protein n=1 Tax=Paenibacillus montanisoli TaxID=2081970 RepID=A0A328U5C8_9BACL|nr:spore germination protein [Paenibacillus montanisoli]RAP77013.1 spore germination protein [Paenibacillus montanisoli]